MDSKKNILAPSFLAAFTLVELLVVVTIIVVLLALLIPALDKAIYQALLVKCGANQKLISTSVIQYALGHKRFYPKRPDLPQGQTGQGGGASAWAVYLPPNSIPTGYDMRPIIRDGLGLKVNATFQCPLIEQIDLEARLPDEFVYGNQALWFGWYYFTTRYGVNENVNGTRVRTSDGGTRAPGMFKLGDRFVYANKKYSVLVSDLDLERAPPTGSQTSHPDPTTGRMHNAVFVRVNILGNAALPHTASFWQEPSGNRGPVDHNYGYDDGSVRMVTQLKERDTRMDDLPALYDGRSDFTQLPSQQ